MNHGPRLKMDLLRIAVASAVAALSLGTLAVAQNAPTAARPRATQAAQHTEGRSSVSENSRPKLVVLLVSIRCAEIMWTSFSASGTVACGGWSKREPGFTTRPILMPEQRLAWGTPRFRREPFRRRMGWSPTPVGIAIPGRW